ncbi:MAG: hypothetical protein D9V45_06890 [Chloroflexi bacterium]|nr:MAG: hypothetical protein D9V45_06890 [Chloroflexota bacterium]
MKRLRVQVLYEHGPDYRPFSSSYIRLLRPFSHPGLSEEVDVVFTPTLLNRPTDLVILDRLGDRQNVSREKAERLVSAIKDLGAYFIYFADDDLSSPAVLTKGYTATDSLVFRHYLETADLTVVTTEALKSRLFVHHSRCAVIPNYLDERLIVRNRRGNSLKSAFVIGYMGTSTHNEDLGVVLPALHKLQSDHPEVVYEFIGVQNNQNFKTLPFIDHLKYRVAAPQPEEIEYPLFYLWWTSSVDWDLAIAPLQENEFNQNKSDIKFLDYAANGVPGIFSDVPIYRPTVQSKGTLAPNTTDSWLTALNAMYNDRILRESTARKASHYLFSDRILHKGISEYRELLLNC